ncbi:hypothetical protein [Actinacidiphila sp. bgisy144]|uniref:hypothetical protein n=1 Tax=unclassified Actinacidiphila TaxID=2995708 RepID=UPI003EBCF0A3
MSGRALRVGGAVGGALMLLAGCSFGAHPHATATASPSAASAPPPVGSIEHPRPVECVDGFVPPDNSPSPPRRTTHPAGSPTTAPTSRSPHSPHSTRAASPSTSSTTSASTSASQTADPSVTAHPGTTPSGTADPTTAPAGSDIAVGPLTWQGLGDLADGEQRDLGRQNSGGWHYRIDTLLHAGTSVTVTVGAEQRARAGLEFGGEYGSAPAPAVSFHACPGSPTSFHGAFFVAGDGRACVPLDIKVGDTPTRHVVISFFSGRCPA